jgi:hypothetical protein
LMLAHHPIPRAGYNRFTPALSSRDDFLMPGVLN